MSSGGPVGPRDAAMTSATAPRWLRSQRASAIDVGEDLLLLGRDGVIRRLAAESAELARVVLAYVAEPRTAAEILAHVESLAGELGERRAIVEQVIELLAEATAIAHAATAPTAATTPRHGANVVVGISGAIAASHAPALVAALQRRGHTVEVALTPTAQRFVAVDALTAILQRAPHTSLWPAVAHAPVPHVALAQWADLVVIYPASATTIARLAGGDFSDLVAAIALTTRAPVLVVPSMNDAMLDAPAVQRNLARLREDGHAILHGVPSTEVADAPSVRTAFAGAAPAASEVAATIDALVSSAVLPRRDTAALAATGESPRRDATSATPRDWDAAYRRPLVPWARADCDPDLAAALARHAPSPRRVLDAGCGLGQVAVHAAAGGHHVVASDISHVALAAARTHAGAQPHTSGAGTIVFVRDDLCATALVGPFDVIVDRAVLHTLPPHRTAAYAAAIRRLLAPGGVAIVKCHRDGAGSTIGYTGRALAALLDLELVSETPAELPSPSDAAPIPAILCVLSNRE
jgi:SAM-dependent methyltransferase/3-polyprenyl-4-hydroxybenzoate decarboxylase